jgi:hypothetical protein
MAKDKFKNIINLSKLHSKNVRYNNLYFFSSEDSTFDVTSKPTGFHKLIIVGLDDELEYRLIADGKEPIDHIYFDNLTKPWMLDWSDFYEVPCIKFYQSVKIDTETINKGIMIYE